MAVPCEECIVYARCHMQDHVKCSILFNHIKKRRATVREVKTWIPDILSVADTNPPTSSRGLRAIAFVNTEPEEDCWWSIVTPY